MSAQTITLFNWVFWSLCCLEMVFKIVDWELSNKFGAIINYILNVAVQSSKFLFENWAWIQFKFKLTYCIMLKQSLFKKYNFTAYIKSIMTWLSRNLHGIYKLTLFLKMAELIHVGCIQCIQYHYNLKFNNANWLWIEHLKEFVTCYNWLWTLQIRFGVFTSLL